MALIEDEVDILETKKGFVLAPQALRAFLRDIEHSYQGKVSFFYANNFEEIKDRKPKTDYVALANLKEVQVYKKVGVLFLKHYEQIATIDLNGKNEVFKGNITATDKGLLERVKKDLMEVLKPYEKKEDLQNTVKAVSERCQNKPKLDFGNIDKDIRFTIRIEDKLDPPKKPKKKSKEKSQSEEEQKDTSKDPQPTKSGPGIA
jgi:hypothetical protein